jgi:hypothetical protein
MATTVRPGSLTWLQARESTWGGNRSSDMGRYTNWWRRQWYKLIEEPMKVIFYE